MRLLHGLTAAFLTVVPALAFAGTVTIDGITIPIGIVPGGNHLEAGIVESNVITAPGQSLGAIGLVTSITDQNANFTWLTGQNGVELGFTVTGFTATSVTAPTGSTAGTILFNGGTLNFYTLPSGFALTGRGTTAADIAAIQGGTLWLGEQGVPIDANGDTLIASIPIGSTLTNFSNGTVAGDTDVLSGLLGGDAGDYFNTNTFANAFDTASNGFSDTTNSANFNTGVVADGFAGSGTAFLKANTQYVPEPGMIGLFTLGIGFLIAGALRICPQFASVTA